MTRRARSLLDALEAGCETRREIFEHAGAFSLLNNGAAELRACGIPVDCVLIDGEYRYLLGGGPSGGQGALLSPAAAGTARVVRQDAAVPSPPEPVQLTFALALAGPGLKSW